MPKQLLPWVAATAVALAAVLAGGHAAEAGQAGALPAARVLAAGARPGAADGEALGARERQLVEAGVYGLLARLVVPFP